MRFITEFELEPTKSPEWHIEHSQRRLGEMILDSFGIFEYGFISRSGAAAIRRSLEIEAFPMDKWIEFKQRLFMECGMPEPNGVSILEMIKELEFHVGKEKLPG